MGEHSVAEPAALPTECIICGETDMRAFFMCDRYLEKAWCPRCFRRTPCAAGKHGEGCATGVFAVSDEEDEG